MRVRSSARSFFVAILMVFSAAFAWGQGGTVTGTVHLTGTPRANPLIRMGADPNCLKINAGKRVYEELVLKSSDGGLANVFVHVSGAPNASGSGTVTLDQQGCTYHPRIVSAQVGQTLAIKNDDSTLHNVHAVDPSKKYDFDQAQPTAGMVLNVPLKSEEIMLHVKCNVHPWMTGYIGIAGNPYYALSDASGKFTIKNVPAGKQTIEVWHEIYGPLTQTVDVKAGGTVNVDFTYTGNEHPAASKLMPIQEITIPATATAVSFIPPSR
ncbi:MAG: carboxypeptidase regulatory-like domain-containing protein [Candidatus Sulfotelmatobacter sp.]|jgi:plastocyanin